MTEHLYGERNLAASPEAAWEVLADFSNIAKWNPYITGSYATSDIIEGVGAKRHCDATIGHTEECVLEWVPNKKLVIDVESSKGLPFNEQRMTFTIQPSDKGALVGMAYDVEPKGGPLKGLLMRRIRGRLESNFDKVLAGLEEAAQKVSV